ncbi:hypothetical protein PA07A_2000 [Cutibacterium acnes P07A]|nr:hypothetical protein [Cutibacterium acnes P07A]
MRHDEPGSDVVTPPCRFEDPLRRVSYLTEHGLSSLTHATP